ncbi:hypothetical protein V8G54_030684 [Vigna mungo]|uniref:Uncharacterized protein n=1 Tax=Vigna mungo TaxID=3915 RepID=A0AAQ3RN35_VIGMU
MKRTSSWFGSVLKAKDSDQYPFLQPLSFHSFPSEKHYGLKLIFVAELSHQRNPQPETLASKPPSCSFCHPTSNPSIDHVSRGCFSPKRRTFPFGPRPPLRGKLAFSSCCCCHCHSSPCPESA